MIRRLVLASVIAAAAIGLIVFASMSFLASSPGTVQFNTPPGKPIHLTMQTDGTIGFGVHPTWVSYLVQSPSGSWEPTTIWQLPAHTKIDVTEYEFDSGSPLRNQEIGLLTGVSQPRLNGKPIHLINSNSGNGVAHTFSVPELGINVPLYGVNSSAKNFCNAGPCTLAEAHNTVTFSFTTPGPGMYRWQCFVPCGLGYLFGNGGPMQTMGYMAGFLDVT